MMEAGCQTGRLAHVALEYEKLCDRSYFGPQGPNLSIFLEEACDLKQLTRCNLEMYRTQGTRKKEFRQYFTISRHYERVESTVKAKNKHMHSITDTLMLTPEGEQYLSLNKVSSDIAYEMILRCGGGSYRGKPSGSNCVRVAYKPGWCTGSGECSDECEFAKLRDSNDRLEHMCDFTVTISATLRDIKAGKRRIHIDGNHGYTSIDDWIPPTRLRETVHLREKAVKAGTTLSGPSASDTLSFINSPSGAASRSFMPSFVYYKMVENYKRGNGIHYTRRCRCWRLLI